MQLRNIFTHFSMLKKSSPFNSATSHFVANLGGEVRDDAAEAALPTILLCFRSCSQDARQLFGGIGKKNRCVVCYIYLFFGYHVLCALVEVFHELVGLRREFVHCFARCREA